MFAGPNGSGKSTVIKTLIRKPAKWYGIYLNADDLEAQIKTHQALPLSNYGFQFDEGKLAEFFAQSDQLKGNTHIPNTSQILIQNGILSFTGFEFDSYHAATLIEYFRYQAITERKSFTFETVMPHPSKVQFLADARSAGFQTYLYFVATENADINVRRVQNRVSEGGHTVSEDKIRSRYRNSIALLESAIRNSDRAFLFDTSEEDRPI